MDNIKEKVMKEEEAKAINEDMKKKADMNIMDELLKTNQMEFSHNDKTYRIRQLTLADKEILNDMIMHEHGRLMQDQNILTENQYRTLYKQKEVGLDIIEDKIKKLDAEKFAIQLKLGEALGNKVGDTILSEYKKQIETITNQTDILLIQRGELMHVFQMKAMTYLSFDIKIEDKWIRLYNTYEEFQAEKDEELITKAAYRSYLLHNVL